MKKNLEIKRIRKEKRQNWGENVNKGKTICLFKRESTHRWIRVKKRM